MQLFDIEIFLISLVIAIQVIIFVFAIYRGASLRRFFDGYQSLTFKKMGLEEAQEAIDKQQAINNSTTSSADSSLPQKEKSTEKRKYKRYRDQIKEEGTAEEGHVEEEATPAKEVNETEEVAAKAPQDDPYFFYENTRKNDTLYIPIQQLNRDDALVLKPVKDVESPIYLGVYSKRSDHKGSRVFTTLYIDKTFLAGVINNQVVGLLEDLITINGFKEGIVAKADNIQIDEGRIVWHDGQWKINRKSVVSRIIEL